MDKKDYEEIVNAVTMKLAVEMQAATELEKGRQERMEQKEEGHMWYGFYCSYIKSGNGPAGAAVFADKALRQYQDRYKSS